MKNPQLNIKMKNYLADRSHLKMKWHIIAKLKMCITIPFVEIPTETLQEVEVNFKEREKEKEARRNEEEREMEKEKHEEKRIESG